MPGVALTDHGTFAGAITFLKACRKAGIKPILGMEAYQARDHKCHSKDGQKDARKGNRHVNVIAKNFTGYRNICALSQKASLEGTYYDPRIDFELLEQHKEGLIVTSACLSNVVNANLLHGREKEATEAAAIYKDLFGDDYYLEMMYHGLDSEAKILPGIKKISKDLGIKTIITNDCHYLEQDDAETHEVLMCMSSGRPIKDPNRIKFPFAEFYFKSYGEMWKTWWHEKQSLQNTVEISEKCDYSDIIFVEDGGEMRLPKYVLPAGYNSPHEYLAKLAWDGLKSLGLHTSEAHVNRLKLELSDIKLIWDTKRYDFATYFLVVEQLMSWAKSKGISSGIRGSGFGSVLLQCLGITEGVDPLEQELLWERFLGFDDSYFLSEEDFGMSATGVQSGVVDEGDDDATERMFDRYS